MTAAAGRRSAIVAVSTVWRNSRHGPAACARPPRRQPVERRRPLPLQRGIALPAVRQARLAPDDDRRGTRRALRGVGAQRRLRVGRSATSTAGTPARIRSRRAGASGIWEGFVPGVGTGTLYKYHVASPIDGYKAEKSDPFGLFHEVAPKTASIVWDLDYTWDDAAWMASRGPRNTLTRPISIYEMHLGSWMRDPEDGFNSLTYREMAPRLADYVKEMGFTHVELLPVMEHPFFGSWGYQMTGYFAPTSRYGTPAGLHVPDRHPAPARHRRDPRLGAVALPDRRARPRLLRRHAPLRARRPAPGVPPGLGQLHLQLRPPRGRELPHSPTRCSGSTSTTSTACAWMPSRRCSTSTTRARRASGSPTSTAAARTSRRSTSCAGFNDEISQRFPDVQTIAEESTAWPMVSRPTYVGGLGFGLKWDMGWMHDTLKYFAARPDPPPATTTTS